MRINYFFCLYLFLLLESNAQDFKPLFEPGAEYTLILKDGTKLTGTVMEFNDGVVAIRTRTGDFRVHIKDIKKIKGGPEKTSDSNKNWFASPKKGTYVLGPSGIPLEPNEFDYQNNFIIINTLNYGVTNAVSVGGGIELISTLWEHPIYYLNPRVSVPVNETLHLGTGILFLSAPTLDIDAANSTASVKQYYDLGVIYGSAAFGTSDRNITVIAGYGVLNSKAASRPTISLSGVYRLGAKIALISENWLIPDFYIVSYGMRLMTRRVVFDFTLLNNLDWYSGGQIFPGIPFVSFMVRLGKLREEP